MDASHKWKVSNECFYCNKHRYSIVFFTVPKKGKYQDNQGLVEITNPGVVSRIRESLNFGFRDQEDSSPVIAGTVV